VKAAAIDRHAPDPVLYIASADPCEADRWGRRRLTVDSLREV
jgi:hypothetical protein